MEAINRLTTQFVDLEDRIQVRAATVTGKAVTLWLPQRLLNRVIPPLCKRLDPTEGQDRVAEIKNSFAQQAAVQSMTPQPAVEQQSICDVFTIRSISIRARPSATEIIFDDRVEQSGSRFSITLDDQQLRQWLSILHAQYVRAEWSLLAWPDWIANAKRADQAQPSLLQ